MTTTEFEFTIKKADGTTDIHKCSVFLYNYRIPVGNSGEIYLDMTMYEPVPDFLLRFAKEQEPADLVIKADLPERKSILFRNIKIVNHIYESCNLYPGSAQVNTSLSLSAESCVINGVEFESVGY